MVTVERVLVVDDNAENRLLARATLDDEDIACTVVTNGEDALAAFVLEPPDCVLLDIRMPGLDGIEVCRRMRALPGGERVAIVFVTAQRDVDSFDEASRAGGDDFLTKPFNTAELVVRIQTAIHLRRLTAAHHELAAQLKRQRDQLQRLQLQKEQLTQFLIHDFKNPVNSIYLHAQRVLRNTADERSHDAAERIQGDSRALLRMISNLLDIGKADEGQLAPTRERIELGRLIDEVVVELRPLAAAVDVTIAVHVVACELELDRDLMFRVLANLVDNAIRHAPEATALTISARPLSPAAVELRVVDAGSGVPIELRTRIFERFVSAGDDIVRTNRGLGLAFCRVAIEAHGGRIWVEDANPGAAFCIELPTRKTQ
jgi:two-component system sensor histidine kinase/response regulator